MLRSAKAAISKAAFDFTGWLYLIGILTNPFFLVRKNLYIQVKELARELSGNVLDFGCGCKPYQKYFSHCSSYMGCDIEISGHRHENENIDVFYDGSKLPFDDDYFDGVFSTEVFEHIFNLDEIISELSRVMKEGGMLLVTVPFVWNEHEVPYDCARYTSFGIKALLEREGFVVIEQRKSTNYVEMVFQMAIEYIRARKDGRKFNNYMSLMLNVLLIAPLTVCGLVMGKILPCDYGWYGDNVVLCRKAGKGEKTQWA